MIRPFTCLCLLLAAGAGLYVYQEKHAAALQDSEVERIVKETEAIRQRIGVLRAEYALLNDPSRLADLATAHLPNLRATAPTQFTTLAELDRRLPPVGAPPPPEPTPAESPQTTLVSAAPAASAPAAAILTAAKSVPPTVLRSAAILSPAAATNPTPSQADSPVQQAALAPPSARKPVVRHATAKAPRNAVVRATPPGDPFMIPAATPSDAVAHIAHSGPVNPGVPVVGSALGMARSLSSPAVAPASATGFASNGR